LANELIINATESGLYIALLKDRKLVELHQEKGGSQFSVGDIYLGQIRKIMPGLNAAFVNVGYEKDAFLHYLDLGPQIRSLNKFVKFAQQGSMRTGDLSTFKPEKDIVKTGKITEVFQKGNHVLVQVVKEPISTKGPRISSEISMAGRYMVLVPFSNQISVSKKIKSFEERSRLKNLAASIKPQGFGVIIRTVAEETSAAELHKDLLELTARWNEVAKKLHKSTPPNRILGEMDKTSSLLRDLLNDSFTNIVVNTQQVYDEVRKYVAQISPDMEKIVKLHSAKNSIFDQYGIDKQIKLSFGKTVSFQGGSYLIIEHTEALHVIDVNSGSKSDNDNNQEENALKVNLEAAGEIARQLRLRDMGGIIVVDFIDQKNAGNKRIVYERLKEEMKSDRARHNILPMSKFGLIQITRQRVRPEMTIETLEVCPMCKGTGQAGPSIVITDEIEQKLAYLFKNVNVKDISISTHPYIASYLKAGFPSLRQKWFFKYKRWVKIEEDNTFHFGEYHFLNSVGEEIVL
jgi:ribonuclease G